VLSFLLEIAMLVAFGYWGFNAAENPWLRWVLGIGVPLVVIIVWGVLLAPTPGQRISSTLGIVLSLFLFYVAALLMYQAGQPVPAAVMFFAAAINRTLVVIWKQ
jgi:hypothetical protein